MTYVGTLFSAYGFRTWDLWVSENGLCFFRHKFKRTVRYLFGHEIGFPDDPISPPNEPRSDDHIFSTNDLSRIHVKKKTLSHNEVVVTINDGTTYIFGVMDGSRTDEIRQSLRGHCIDKYIDEGFESEGV